MWRGALVRPRQNEFCRAGDGFPAPCNPKSLTEKGTSHENHLNREDAEDRADQDTRGGLSLLQPRLLIAFAGR